MLVLPLAFALAAAGSSGEPPAAVRVVLLELGGSASAEDRAAVRTLLDDALVQRGLGVVREGHPPADCGAPCLGRIAGAAGADLVLTGELAASGAGLEVALVLFDAKRVDAPTTRASAGGADLNSLGAELGDALDPMLAPALALRGLGKDAVREGLGWGTPGLILGGSLTVAGVTLAGFGLLPFVDRAVASAEVDRLRAEGGSPAELAAASGRVSAAHQALTEWGLSALSMGAGATLVGAAMMSAAASE